MSEELVFYANPMSRSRIARWMLEEVGCPYRTEWLAYGAPMKAPEYLSVNPMGKVPAIVHGRIVVTEAAAICAYLADVFPEAGLAPAPADRGAYYRWLLFAAGPLEAVATARSLGLEAPPDKASMAGYGSYGDVMNALETAVEECRYVAGERFSAADVYVASQIGWGMEFGSIEARPAFQAYWEGHKDRTARLRAERIDDEAARQESENEQSMQRA